MGKHLVAYYIIYMKEREIVITFLIGILFLIGLLLIVLKFTRTSMFCLTLTFILFFMDSLGFLPTLLLNNLETYSFLSQPKWAKNNVIILLGAGAEDLPQSNIVKPTPMAYPRIFEAARLYNLCKKSSNNCTIIISGGDALSKAESEAEVYQTELNNIGINNTNIILESRSLNTYQNAEFTSDIIKSKHFDNIILDTSGIHMKRALLYFSHFGINPTPAISDYMEPELFISTLGYNMAISDFAMHEYAGIMRYYIYNFFGLNSHPNNK